MMSRAKVDGFWLDAKFPTGDLKYSTIWRVDQPSGCYMASVRIACDPNYEAPWTVRGKRFQAISPAGGRKFGGMTVEPERNEDGLTLHAIGFGSTLEDYPAIWFDPVRSLWLPTFTPNDAVDAAVARGAMFSRFGVNLGSDSLLQDGDSSTITVGQLLSRAATLEGKHVHVDADGAITFRADPTEPEFTTPPDPTYMGTADDQLVTRLWGTYYVAGQTVFRVRVLSGSGGTFTLSGNGATSAATAYNATAGTVETRVQSLGGVFASATVEAAGSTSWLVTVPHGGVQLTGSGASLTGGGLLTIAIGDTFRVVDWEDTAARDVFGPREKEVNLSNLGPLDHATAQDYIDGRGAKVGGRMGYTANVDLGHNNLMRISGAYAHARDIEAGQMLQIPDVRDARSNPTVRAAIWFVLSLVEVTEGARPKSVATPMGFTSRDFEGALANPEKPADKETA